jgi:type IV secretion system protein VirB9
VQAGTDIDFDYAITGNAPWRPLRTYSTAGKTYIQFPKELHYASAPALIGLGDDGGWFSSPSQQMLIYRIRNDSYIVDGLFNRADLVSGVGDDQTKVEIKRGRK